MSARELALRFARRGWVGSLISFSLRHFFRVLPLKRVYEDAGVVAFHHPAPSHDPHILIIPKARARTVFDLPESGFRAALRAGSEIALRSGTPLRLQINGGARQEVMQAHFHLYPAGNPKGCRVETFSAALARARGARWFSLVVMVDVKTGAAEGIFVERD